MPNKQSWSWLSIAWLLLLIIAVPIFGQDKVNISLTPSPWQPQQDTTITQLALHPRESFLAYALDQQVFLYALGKERALLTFSDNPGSITSLVFSANGEMLAAASKESIQVWEIPGGEKQHTLSGHTATIQALQFHPSGKILASASQDQTVKLWSLEEEKAVATIETKDAKIQELSFSSRGNVLLAKTPKGYLFWKLLETTEQPQTSLAFYQRGVQKKALSNLEGAIDDLNTATSLDPSYKEAYFELACAYSLRSQTHENPAQEAEDISKAIHYLGQAFKNGFDNKEKLRLEKELQFIHIDPRYQKLLAKQGWQEYFSVQKDKRKIVLKITSEQGETAEPLRVLNHGQPISLDEPQPINQVYNIEVRFEDYENYQKEFWLDQGKGPYLLHVPLKKLRTLEFSLRDNEVEIDGITYPYEIYVDSQPLPEHLIEIDKGRIFQDYKIKVPYEAQRVRIYGGYFYTEKAAVWLSGRISRLDKIDVNKLLEHLQTVAERSPGGYQTSLRALERVLQSRYQRDMIKDLSRQEQIKLLDQVERWDLPASSQQRLRMLIDVLERLIRY